MHIHTQNEPMKADEATDQLTLLREAMEIIGFFEGSQASIFKLCAAILLLGNITFRSVSFLCYMLRVLKTGFSVWFVQIKKFCCMFSAKQSDTQLLSD